MAPLLTAVPALLSGTDAWLPDAGTVQQVNNPTSDSLVAGSESGQQRALKEAELQGLTGTVSGSGIHQSPVPLLFQHQCIISDVFMHVC